MISNFKFQISNSQNGYSLIELVVVLAIFLIILTASINVLIAVVQDQKRTLENQELLNQSSYVMEYMSKALKSAVQDPTGWCLGTTGYVYLLTHCNNGTQEACNGIKFINQSDGNACQEFFLDDSVNILNPPLREVKTGGYAKNLLSEKFKVKYGRFIINGDRALHVASTNDLIQPRVSILLDVLNSKNEAEKIIQTTVSLGNLIEGE
ncbi:MAG: hypothetical protein A3D44_01705 [Candidatus Staskawiczbacteria bacterium RIFCSPHIGHO2_02_FULL_42_22]|uniref:Prepilin-type N-terminal cleavage/methylation domain-containing protein n=1 Tax=Candidatus Staskawiczbacteria bacterium RIFCSPHIGHO2_02_FULL_42_22 TaxID=1802207 RepID=A0A1G2I0P1_9BACT|nr:MAG: hypothetical protein A3D44_01705 [Candidatus Staskawiczbacteria bacterium RIFCSPHIGHO2_02_FULL_42_22]